MSVLVPDPQVYNYIHQGLILAAYRRTCDEHYSYTMHVHFKDLEIHKEARRLVHSWMTLNERSYLLKYEKRDIEKSEDFRFVKWELVNVRPLQLLKYLKCVRYNIEIETIQHKGDLVNENLKAVSERALADMELLSAWTEELMMAIIDKIPEYDDAKWSEAPDNKWKMESLKQ